LRASELIETAFGARQDERVGAPEESVATGLICLQKDSTQAIKEQNFAFLALLIIAYKNVSNGESIQEVNPNT
jgi:hypothetical protein